MEVALIIFSLLSLSILGALCLLVLEFQNKRARRWTRMWSDLERQPHRSVTRVAVPADDQVLHHDLSAAD